jgi:hypothetical protein
MYIVRFVLFFPCFLLHSSLVYATKATVPWKSISFSDETLEHTAERHFFCLPKFDLGKKYVGAINTGNVDVFIDIKNNNEEDYAEATSGFVYCKEPDTKLLPLTSPPQAKKSSSPVERHNTQNAAIASFNSYVEGVPCIFSLRKLMMGSSCDFKAVFFRQDGTTVPLAQNVPERKNQKLFKYRSIVQPILTECFENGDPVWKAEFNVYNAMLKIPHRIRTFILLDKSKIKPTICLHFPGILNDIFNRTEIVAIALERNGQTIKTLYPVPRFIFWSEGKLKAVVKACQLADKMIENQEQESDDEGEERAALGDPSFHRRDERTKEMEEEGDEDFGDTDIKKNDGKNELFYRNKKEKTKIKKKYEKTSDKADEHF